MNESASRRLLTRVLYIITIRLVRMRARSAFCSSRQIIRVTRLESDDYVYYRCLMQMYSTLGGDIHRLGWEICLVYLAQIGRIHGRLYQAQHRFCEWKEHQSGRAYYWWDNEAPTETPTVPCVNYEDDIRYLEKNNGENATYPLVEQV